MTLLSLKTALVQILLQVSYSVSLGVVRQGGSDQSDMGGYQLQISEPIVHQDPAQQFVQIGYVTNF